MDFSFQASLNHFRKPLFMSFPKHNGIVGEEAQVTKAIIFLSIPEGAAPSAGAGG